MREKFKSFTEKAQGMVEFALILPLLLVLLFGIIEAGRMLFIYSSVVSSSREAARYGSASGEYDNVIRYEDCDGIRSAAKRSGTLVDIQDSNISITYDSGPGVPPHSLSCEPSEKVNLGDRINITVSAHYEPIVPLVNFSGFDISSSTARTIIKDVPIADISMSQGSAPDPVVYFPSLEVPIVPEGDTYTITVRLSYPIGEDVTVNLSSFSEDAVLAMDYTVADSVVISATETKAYITIEALDDIDNDEPDETVEIFLDSVVGEKAKIGGPDTSQVVIADTYVPPEVFFILAQDEVLESKGTAIIVAELSFATSKDVSVPLTILGDATNPDDYSIDPPETLLFPAGVKYASIKVTLEDDGVYIGDEDEDIIVTMGPPDPPNATLSGSEPTEHTLTITHPEVYFTLEDQSVDEPTEEKEVTVEVAIDQPSYEDVEVDFSIIDGDAEHPATGTGTDYEIVDPSDAILVIPAGSTSANITLTLTEDELDEYDETITLQLDSSNDAAIGTTYGVHTVTIIDDDEPPEVFFSETSQSAGEASGSMAVGVELSAISGKVITVTYKIDGSSTAKKQGAKADYTIDVVDLVFSPGDPPKFISFGIVDDELDEDNETVVLRLDSAENATIGTPDIHTATIEDDDPKVVEFSSSGQSVDEGAGDITVKVVINYAPTNNVTVPFNVSGSAQSGDYTINANQFEIGSGLTSATITITIEDDELEEEGETIELTLGNPTGDPSAELGDQIVYTVTITANDAPLPVIPLDYGEKTEKWRLLK